MLNNMFCYKYNCSFKHGFCDFLELLVNFNLLLHSHFMGCITWDAVEAYYIQTVLWNIDP